LAIVADGGGSVAPRATWIGENMNRLILSVLGALFCCLSFAIDLRTLYVAPGGDVNGVVAQSGPVDLVPAVDAAARSWESLIGDDWSIDIRYGWSDTIGGALAQYWGWWAPFGDGRHFMGRILFNPSYALYGGFGDVPADRFDVLTLATHELGHSLSIGLGPRWSAEVGDGDVDVRWPLRLAGSAIAIDGDHLADTSSLMYYGLAPGERRFIGDSDLMAAMELSGFAIELEPVSEPSSLIAIGIGVMTLACVGPLGSWTRAMRGARRRGRGLT
jgi:hypothetical protein